MTRTLSATRAAQGDPGYTVSSLIIGEAALGLALDLDRPPEAVGVLTPATAMGTLLVVRLTAAGRHDGNSAE